VVTVLTKGTKPNSADFVWIERLIIIHDASRVPEEITSEK